MLSELPGEHGASTPRSSSSSDVDPSGIFVEWTVEVEMEMKGEEVTLPVEEPRTATAL